MKKITITTSWDDGHPCDLRLADLLKRYNISATFYIPIDNVERECMRPSQISEIATAFDVGGHSYHHLDLTQIPLSDARDEIIKSKEKLEQITGKAISSFCYPGGCYDKNIVGLVKGAGFSGSRTVMLFTRHVKHPYKMGTTVYARNLSFHSYRKHFRGWQDPKLFWFMLRNNHFLKSWDQVAIEVLDFIRLNGGIWHLWGHSWEINQNNDWHKLEHVLNKVQSVSKEVRMVDNSELINKYLPG